MTPPKPFLDAKKHYVFGEFPHAVRLLGTHPPSVRTPKMRLILWTFHPILCCAGLPAWQLAGPPLVRDAGHR